MSDLISRQAAIDAIKEEEYPRESDYDEGYMAALKKSVWIMEKWLPSAQPERKTGEWILDDEYIDCSACKREKWSRVPYERLVKQFRFCPNCGADMRGEA